MSGHYVALNLLLFLFPNTNQSFIVCVFHFVLVLAFKYYFVQIVKRHLVLRQDSIKHLGSQTL